MYTFEDEANIGLKVLKMNVLFGKAGRKDVSYFSFNFLYIIPNLEGHISLQNNYIQFGYKGVPHKVL